MQVRVQGRETGVHTFTWRRCGGWDMGHQVCAGSCMPTPHPTLGQSLAGQAFVLNLKTLYRLVTL
jgi:hypothetical protein